MTLVTLFALLLLVLAAVVVLAHLGTAAARSWVVIARELDPSESHVVEPRLAGGDGQD